VSTTIADAASRQGLPQGNRLRPEEHTTGETALRHAVQDTEPAPSALCARSRPASPTDRP